MAQITSESKRAMVRYLYMPQQPSDRSSDRWNDGLRLVSYCPVCETRYNQMEAKLLGEEGDTRLIYVNCRKCRHSVLALVLVNHVGASSVGLLTDLTYEDVVKFQAAKKVSINDVIDAHHILEDGSWKHSMEPRRRHSKVSRFRS